MGIIELITGKYTGQRLMEILDNLPEELIDSPKKRFNVLMQCDWFYWNNQTWNQNFSGLTFEKYREGQMFQLEPLNEYESNYATIWIHTRAKIWEKNFKVKKKAI